MKRDELWVGQAVRLSNTDEYVDHPDGEPEPYYDGVVMGFELGEPWVRIEGENFGLGDIVADPDDLTSLEQDLPPPAEVDVLFAFVCDYAVVEAGKLYASGISDLVENQFYVVVCVQGPAGGDFYVTIESRGGAVEKLVIWAEIPIGDRALLVHKVRSGLAENLMGPCRLLIKRRAQVTYASGFTIQNPMDSTIEEGARIAM